MPGPIGTLGNGALDGIRHVQALDNSRRRAIGQRPLTGKFHQEIEGPAIHSASEAKLANYLILAI